MTDDDNPQYTAMAARLDRLQQVPTEVLNTVVVRPHEPAWEVLLASTKDADLLVCGAREAESETVSLRHRSGDDLGAVPVDRVITDLSREISAREPGLTVGRS